MALRDGNRIPGSVHDLTATLALSDVADQVLFVSPRTLRLLANLAEVDVKILSRYAKNYLPGGMIDVVEDEDTEAEDVDEISNRFGIEVMPVGIYQPPWVSSAKRAAATQTVANNVFTRVDLDTLVDDEGEAFSLSTDGVIVPTDGFYSVLGRVVWAGNATGIRTISIYLTGVEIASFQLAAVTTSAIVIEINHHQRFAADDNIQLYCRQNSGGNLDLVQFGVGLNNFLSVYRLG
jgi:hypothetical protein